MPTTPAEPSNDADALAKLTTTVREERRRWIEAQAEMPSRIGGIIEALAWVEAQIRIAGLDDAAADATALQIGAAGDAGEGEAGDDEHLRFSAASLETATHTATGLLRDNAAHPRAVAEELLSEVLPHLRLAGGEASHG